MEQGAAWLCERVLPPVPLRQWVLSLPRVLRYLLAYDGRLLRAVSSAAMGEVFRFDCGPAPQSPLSSCEAIAALSVFDEKADPLRALANYIVERRS